MSQWQCSVGNGLGYYDNVCASPLIGASRLRNWLANLYGPPS